PADRQTEVVERLGALLNVDAASLNTQIAERRDQGFLLDGLPVATEVDADSAFRVAEQRALLPGVQLQTDSVRQYLEGPLLSQILGYLGRITPEQYQTVRRDGYRIDDVIGQTGVEQTYEKSLRGQAGTRFVEVDVNGAIMRELGRRDPDPGKNLRLTIDVNLQRDVTEVLRTSLGQSTYGAAIVMNPKTGEILSLVSLPSYDNNIFSRPVSERALAELLGNPGHPLLNHAIATNNPPGSVFKLVTGSAALQEGIATRETEIHSPGVITVEDEQTGAPYYFYDYAPLGLMNFVRGLALSSDVYFYYLAGGYERRGRQEFRGLDHNGRGDRLATYARQFGFGEPLGIDLPSEASGLVPTPQWKRTAKQQPWVLADTYFMGIGQGDVLATPLQVLSMGAVVANGGTLYRPQVVREIVDSAGRVVRPFRPEVIREVSVDDTHLALIREAMYHSVNDRDGAANSAKSDQIVIAGKTGTAEFGIIDPATGKQITHGWFVGYAPYDDPQVAVVVFHQLGGGAATAAPAARQILEHYFGLRPQHTSEVG
ncbi:MAG TPA: penicillin-binding protein 2, partial [Dehalococcoidia bacterium]|nr:penicillin-binding protein 2 [Dehalococcoidia bacterium]